MQYNKKLHFNKLEPNLIIKMMHHMLQQISRPHQHLCESRYYSDSRISPIFIHGNRFFIHKSFFIGIHAINHHNQLLMKVFFSQISHRRKEIFFKYERLLIINIRAIIIIIIVGNLSKAHNSFIRKMDFSFPKFLFIINIRGIIVYLKW